MNVEEYIKDRAQFVVEQVVVDADELDVHLIMKVLEEVFQAGVEEGKINVQLAESKIG